MTDTIESYDKRPASKLLTRPHPVVARLLVIAVFLVIWEISARFFVDPLFLSPPTSVLLAVVPVLLEPGVVEAILWAVFELATAFVLAVLVGLSLGLAIGTRRFAYAALMPIVIFLFAIPQSTLLPVFTLFFGIGPSAKIAYGFTHGVFPILVTVIAAAQKLKPGLTRAAISMGASRFDVIRYVVIPSIIPAFFTSIRLGMAATLIGVLLSELYISQRGIGYFTRSFAIDFDPAGLFALIAILSAIAVLINELLRIAENRFNRWQQQ